MFTKKQIEQLQKLFQINNIEIFKAINDSQKDTITQVHGMMNDSQKDTIEVLLDAIHTGYNMHDKRIERLEDELDLAPLKQ